MIFKSTFDMAESICYLDLPFWFDNVNLLLTDAKKIGLVREKADLFFIGYRDCHLYMGKSNYAR